MGQSEAGAQSQAGFFHVRQIAVGLFARNFMLSPLSQAGSVSAGTSPKSAQGNKSAPAIKPGGFMEIKIFFFYSLWATFPIFRPLIYRLWKGGFVFWKIFKVTVR